MSKVDSVPKWIKLKRFSDWLFIPSESFGLSAGVYTLAAWVEGDAFVGVFDRSDGSIYAQTDGGPPLVFEVPATCIVLIGVKGRGSWGVPQVCISPGRIVQYFS